jgi:hypothetical protein
MTNIIAYVIFFVAGFGFGYAAPPKLKWLPLVFPVLLAVSALLKDGLQGAILVKLLIALLITVAGIAIGWLLDQRAQAREEQYA